MVKITFMGAGSTVFAKNVIGDCMYKESLKDATVALYDIDSHRLEESYMMLCNIRDNMKVGMKIEKHMNRKEALKDANYVINAIQVGGYEPSTVIDFEIPKKYGLRQTIADTLGIGGIFRGLRTIPEMLDFAKDMEQMCPEAYFINYANPMAIVTGAVLKASNIKTVGLCHSVQVCAPDLLKNLDMEYDKKSVQYKIAGINHMAWLLEITKDGKDLYPEIKKRAKKRKTPHDDMVRYELMDKFGYYMTESSEHNAEYNPYFIKSKYPELIERFNIPLDEYPRRCVEQIKDWSKKRKELVNNENIEHKETHEYASFIMQAIETNEPYKIGGNVLNKGLIDNLPKDCVVEVPCMVDASGITPTVVGKLPEQCAALNRTNINVQLMTIEAALTKKKEYIYQAALLDPHTSAELSIDDIISMCDELIEAHSDYLPEYK